MREVYHHHKMWEEEDEDKVTSGVRFFIVTSEIMLRLGKYNVSEKVKF